MRDIKFRAWNAKISKMLYNVQLCGHTGKVASAHSSYDYPVMQFTGLLDKNGKEIYEGDVVRHREFMSMYGRELDQYRNVIVDYMDMITNDMYRKHPSKLEVLGNIHENPELIN